MGCCAAGSLMARDGLFLRYLTHALAPLAAFVMIHLVAYSIWRAL